MWAGPVQTALGSVQHPCGEARQSEAAWRPEGTSTLTQGTEGRSQAGPKAGGAAKRESGQARSWLVGECGLPGRERRKFAQEQSCAHPGQASHLAGRARMQGPARDRAGPELSVWRDHSGGAPGMGGLT